MHPDRQHVKPLQHIRVADMCFDLTRSREHGQEQKDRQHG